jgi:hypothetical protein
MTKEKKEILGKVRLENVRAAFLNAFEARAFGDDGSDPAYGGSFILDKKHPGVKLLNDAIAAVAKEKWEGKSAEILKQLRAGDKICLRDGDTKPEYDGFPGNFFVAARNKARPFVCDRDKSPLTAADGKPYSGCYVNVTLIIWAQANKWGKRINATLSGIQFYKDGDAFSGAPPASPDDFEDLSEGADASDEI